MKKGNKIIVAIIVILVILMLAGGAFAYLYVATDTFRTDKEMFFKYFAQLMSEEDGFLDKRIQQFEDKKRQEKYENSGNIKVEAQYPEESTQKAIEKVNDMEISFVGKIDSINKMTEQKIEIDYGNDVILPINYKKDNSAIGLQTDKLSKKYIAVKNENLKQLLTNFGVEDVSEVPDTIEISKISEVISKVKEKIEFTDEEKQILKQTYGTVIEKNILDENFSTIKTGQNESYILELDEVQTKNIIIKMLEATKENTLIIDKINEVIMLGENSDIEKIDVTIIDDLISSINGENITNTEESIIPNITPSYMNTANTVDMPNLKITLNQANKKLKQIIIQIDDEVTTIEKNETADSLSYNVTSKTEEKNDATDNSTIGGTLQALTQYQTYCNIQYKGLDAMDNVQEIYEFGISLDLNETSMKYDYKINNNTKFTDLVSIEELDKESAVFLNDYDETQVKPFLTQVGTKLLAINKAQMNELGLEEYENPILYSNPITMLGFAIFNAASESITNANLSQYEIQMFNDKFINYEGRDVRGAEVNALIQTVQTNNLSATGSDGHLVKLTVDGVETSQKVSSSNSYNIEAVYDENGYVVEMKVTTNN